MTDAVSSLLFYALSNDAYRVSLHGPGDELEGGVQIPLGLAQLPPDGAEQWHAARELFSG